MAIRGETTQFTARIETRMIAVIRRLAEREGISTNEKLNEIVTLGLIALAQRKKKAVGGTTAGRNQSATGANNNVD